MTENSSYDQNLKQLNKYSTNKISKPIKKYSPFDHHQQLNGYQPKQQKTHVYNINKSDFRTLVQQLTGPNSSSQFHHPLPPPQPPLIHNPKPQISSRLYSIRPPPLTTKTPVLSSATTITTVKDEEYRPQVSGLSPLPAFPSVNFTAESPISAYMRYLRSSTPTNTTNTNDFESSKGQFDFLNTCSFPSPTTTAQLEFPPTTLAPSWKNV
ncbi:VQ motif-containing protein 9-like [Papaver somniferum]|uniref:VQ motif-containing protein 9-like n=1 Tax=Papaver somniferum TaxID=3469 RepID=UPI000E6FC707|nr:VQ motif-containing protein 9-like [Papaver somniferum]